MFVRRQEKKRLPPLKQGIIKTSLLLLSLFNCPNNFGRKETQGKQEFLVSRIKNEKERKTGIILLSPSPFCGNLRPRPWRKDFFNFSFSSYGGKTKGFFLFFFLAESKCSLPTRSRNFLTQQNAVSGVITSSSLSLSLPFFFVNSRNGAFCGQKRKKICKNISSYFFPVFSRHWQKTGKARRGKCSKFSDAFFGSSHISHSSERKEKRKG